MIEGLQGTVDKIGVTVSRKLTDGNYGSFEVAYYIEASIADAQTDVDEQFEILDTYLTNKVGKSAHDKEQKIGVTQQPPKSGPAYNPSAPPAPTQHAGMLDGVPEDWCPIHNCQMKKYSNEKGSWYSHKSGDKWCKGKA